ncbi:hypothetical protein MSAR_09900 [Mycolicibacterium sarraceniae]|uniref:Uncharacterized protein n=1 Tax=Mycolicibacterium sarraceniae TaxID=1534348 RepID=A0A7I7SLI3_9MYCO|nr:hypothetical protein MSAR_09900 [Mycolicibacterium sarraceniae]
MFDRQGEFDITRSPNPHFGFGGGRAAFPPRHQPGQGLHSNVIHGVKRLPVKLA